VTWLVTACTVREPACTVREPACTVRGPDDLFIIWGAVVHPRGTAGMALLPETAASAASRHDMPVRLTNTDTPNRLHQTVYTNCMYQAASATGMPFTVSAPDICSKQSAPDISYLPVWLVGYHLLVLALLVLFEEYGGYDQCGRQASH